MHAKDLFVHDGRNWQAVEAVGEGLPELDAVSALAFVVESVYPIDVCTFVVSAQHKEVFGVLDLVCEQQTYCFHRLLAPIHVVTQEEIVGLWWKSTIFKEPQQVRILTMDVS